MEDINHKAKSAPVEDISPEEASRILGELSSQLDQARREAIEYKDRYLRARADYDNFKKRAERDAQDIIRRGKTDFILKVIDAIDDFERAMASNTDGSTLKDGLSLTLKKLAGVLEAEGLSPIKALGEPFDPAFHEAVAVCEDDVEGETVSDELRRGYTFCGSTIRPSVVRVAVPRKP
jgi:molecular chaperone GrpE